jgi:hypothetical protein
MNMRKNLIAGMVGALMLFTTACDEQKFLNEVPLDFFSLENSYKTANDYERALTDLYARVREINFGIAENVNYFAHFQATDIAKHARGDADRFGDYNVWLVPTNSMVKFHWESWYKVISNANTIISRIETSDIADTQKQKITGEAKFFRAYAYRYLVYLFGGVPLILEEVASPRTDLTRASREAVLQQIALDAEEASRSLPSINQVVDGKVSDLVAFHLLSETYITLGRYDDAIAAATRVINHPHVQLMKNRFGARVAETDKDVYWDLFQRGNQRRSAGNTETLWLARMEPDVPGGLLVSSGGSQNCLERYAVPAGWTLTDPDGKTGMNGQGMSDYNMGGRGVSFMMNTDYYLYDLWESDWDNDIRNASHNIVRDVKYTNRASVWYDSSAVKYPSQNGKLQPWRWYPWPSKATTPADHPDELYADKANKILKATSGSTYRDMYILRLAETYLLRAEAYVLKGEKALAADDVNQVRSRSKAKAITAGEATLEFLLDERARELVYEEHRRITLHRMGLLVERVRKYNDLNRDDIKDFHDLWPIPNTDIEANKDAKIDQNPGYN